MAKSDFTGFEPELRLFLSADIVGSTAFKQLTRRSGSASDNSLLGKAPVESWVYVISGFFREFSADFHRKWARIKQDLPENWSSVVKAEPKFWKGRGDEILYSARLTDPREALALIRAWIEAIHEQRANFQKREDEAVLDIKGSAWIAGFPINNAFVCFENNFGNKLENSSDTNDDPVISAFNLYEKIHNGGEPQGIVDYIGPSIDTGFRIATLATPRKFIISVDLAYLVAYAALDIKSTYQGRVSKPKIYFDGRVSLKGVTGGNAYPCFWLDAGTTARLDEHEDKLLSLNPVTHEMVRDFCDEYFKSSLHRFVMRPFIKDCKFGGFDGVPPRHDELLGQLNNYLTEEDRKQNKETSDIELSDSTDRTNSAVTENMDGETSTQEVENSISMILDILPKIHLG
ncbi:hypothetical protein [Candidatus Methylomicrobium oryzae]|uniref:hypothetical protein n=1 Tax=Candidatus Methylomicrobium oryzae TaxID=2802053 RepID=UPI001920CBDA|nr:hypothetical protein [Methylomicrobium sp. RS1]MBL1262078.1 hypothetical protein [Methylomicrobium sp. RS1]